jgi:hypothetical protein
MSAVAIAKRVFAALLSPAVWRFLFITLFIAVCFLSLKSRPQIRGTAIIPATFADFFDLYDLWKNIVGFGCLALAGFLGWPRGWGRKVWPHLIRVRVQVYGLIGLVCLMESCQLFIPTRYADPKDVLAGGIGVVLAWCLSTALQTVARWRATHLIPKEASVKRP